MSGLAIKPSCDRKTRLWRSQKNTFGLLHGPENSCPGATTGEGGCFCPLPGRKTRTCYVDSLIKCYSGIRGVLEHNMNVVRTLDKNELADVFDNEFARFERIEDKRGNKKKLYRLLWAGDFADEKMAVAVAESTTRHPDVTFWGYTRSFFAIKHFAGLENVVIHASADKANMREAKRFVGRHRSKGNVHMSVMSPDDPGREFPACPVDIGSMAQDGACQKCELCLKTGVWFKQR